MVRKSTSKIELIRTERTVDLGTRLVRIVYIYVFQLIPGLQLCFGQPVDRELLELVKKEVADLSTSVQTWKFESDEQV